MAEHKPAHKTDHHKPVAPKAPVLVSPPSVSPPGGGTSDQSGLKWYQKKIMGVPMWVFLGIGGAIAAYFLYEYIAGGSAGTAAATVPSSAAGTPTTADSTGGGTAGSGSTGSAGGGGIVDPISSNSGVGNAAGTVVNGPAAPPAPPLVPNAVPNSAKTPGTPSAASILLQHTVKQTLLNDGQTPKQASTAAHNAAVLSIHVPVKAPLSGTPAQAKAATARKVAAAKTTANRAVLTRNGKIVGAVVR